MVSIRFRIVYESYTIVNESYTIGVRLGSIRFRIVYDSYTIVYDWHTVSIRLVSIRVSFFKHSKKQRIRAAVPAPAGGLRKFSTWRTTYLWSYLGDCQNSACRKASKTNAGGLQKISTAAGAGAREIVASQQGCARAGVVMWYAAYVPRR